MAVGEKREGGGTTLAPLAGACVQLKLCAAPSSGTVVVPVRPEPEAEPRDGAAAVPVPESQHTVDGDCRNRVGLAFVSSLGLGLNVEISIESKFVLLG